MRTTILTALALSFAFTAAAQAHWDPKYASADPAVKQWFSTVRSTSGAWCCDEADGLKEGIGAFLSWDITSKGYIVDINGKPFLVPPGAVTPPLYGNPIGVAVVWLIYPFTGSDTIRCFTPGTTS